LPCSTILRPRFARQLQRHWVVGRQKWRARLWWVALNARTIPTYVVRSPWRLEPIHMLH